MYIITVHCTFLFLVYFSKICIAKSIVDERGYGINNGHPVNITDVPFFAIFRPKGKTWHCGASIVHEQFLVTAAHCTSSKHEFEVVVGTDIILPGHGQSYDVEKQFVHPNLSHVHPILLDYDLAVIKLKKKLQLNEKVQIIKMAESTVQLKKGDRVQTFGFGMTEDVTIMFSEILRGVDMPFIESVECAKLFDWPITKHMICAGGTERHLGPLPADSGGALRFGDLLIGAASWAWPYPESNPAGFSSIPSMRDFIDKTIQENL